METTVLSADDRMAMASCGNVFIRGAINPGSTCSDSTIFPLARDKYAASVSGSYPNLIRFRFN